VRVALGAALTANGDPEAACTVLQRAAAVLLSQLGSDHPETIFPIQQVRALNQSRCTVRKDIPNTRAVSLFSVAGKENGIRPHLPPGLPHGQLLKPRR